MYSKQRNKNETIFCKKNEQITSYIGQERVQQSKSPTKSPPQTGREVLSSGKDRAFGRNNMTSQRRGTYFGTYIAEGPMMKTDGSGGRDGENKQTVFINQNNT